MITQRGRPLANDHPEGKPLTNDHPEGQASSCVKCVSEHISSLSGVKYTTKKNHEKLTISRGVNAYGQQPDHNISVFFTTSFTY